MVHYTAIMYETLLKLHFSPAALLSALLNITAFLFPQQYCYPPRQLDVPVTLLKR